MLFSEGIAEGDPSLDQLLIDERRIRRTDYLRLPTVFQNHDHNVIVAGSRIDPLRKKQGQQGQHSEQKVS